MSSCGRGARAATLALALLAAVDVRAQVVTDPADPLYTDLEVWEAEGLLRRLPSLQPYPVQMVRRLLAQVAEHPRARAADRRRASWLLARLDDPLHLTLRLEERLASDAAGPFVRAAIDPTLQGMVTDWLGGSARYQVMVLRTDDGPALPPYAGDPDDLIYDDVHFELAGQSWQVRQVSYGSFGIGDGDGELLFQLGMGRHRAGPFWHDGIIVGQQAPQAGQFSLLMRRQYFTAHVALYELSATDDAGQGSRTGKHLHLHSLEFHPAPWLDLGIFESVVYGGRFELLYFILMVAYFNSQGLTGFSDNSLVGLDARATPLPGADLKAVLYVDDISFNDMARGNFDTKYKLAAQVGVSLAPRALLDGAADLGWGRGLGDALRLVTVDYTAVMPYVFTHTNSGESVFNYESYTNAGQSFGPALPPNSDRLMVRALGRLLDDARSGLLDVEADAALIRHGNASAGIIPDRDGSVLDDGYLDGEPTFQPPFADPTGQPATRFLSQRVLETTLQLGVGASFTLDGARAGRDGASRAWGGVTASARYTLQLQDNARLEDGRREAVQFGGLSLAWRY